jgi:transcriptional regulator
MKRYNFAMLITSGNGRPEVTHLPFCLDVTEERVLLTAHLARANPHWKEFADREVLVVFSGPHAYTSPANYEREENFPTWNYIAVHAYLKVNIVTDEQRGLSILDELILQSEPAYLEQWNRLDAEYRRQLYKGIVPFEITVTDLQAKQKLSQNKTAGERANVIHSLEQEEDSAAKDIAD